ncbi:type II toxin-antitoxin system VapC family toxin, partial [Staphylococcus aureus]
VPATALLDAALEMSITLRHALYDCLYLALAIERRCVMLTSDRKFANVVSESAYRDHIELLA